MSGCKETEKQAGANKEQIVDAVKTKILAKYNITEDEDLTTNINNIDINPNFTIEIERMLKNKIGKTILLEGEIKDVWEDKNKIWINLTTGILWAFPHEVCFHLSITEDMYKTIKGKHDKNLFYCSCYCIANISNIVVHDFSIVADTDNDGEKVTAVLNVSTEITLIGEGEAIDIVVK